MSMKFCLNAFQESVGEWQVQRPLLFETATLSLLVKILKIGFRTFQIYMVYLNRPTRSKLNSTMIIIKNNSKSKFFMLLGRGNWPNIKIFTIPYETFEYNLIIAGMSRRDLESYFKNSMNVVPLSLPNRMVGRR